MMEDTIIANLPPEALRSVLRTLLGVDAKVTPAFRRITTEYLEKSKPVSVPAFFEPSGQKSTPAFFEFQGRYRCLMGCGQGFQTLDALKEVINQARGLIGAQPESEVAQETFAIIDHDIVQATTAVQKQILSSTGLRPLSDSETQTSKKLVAALVSCREQASLLKCEFPFERAKSRVEMLFGGLDHGTNGTNGTNGFKAISSPCLTGFKAKPSKLETSQLGKSIVPRVFMGLWQFSSPAWGTASHSRVTADFRKHVDAGFVSYGMFSLLNSNTLHLLTCITPDMADHYGDAEVTFVSAPDDKVQGGV
jgi:hypothetical protein